MANKKAFDMEMTYTGVDGNTHIMKLRKTLSYTELISCIELIVAGVFADGQYHSYVEDVAYTDALLRFFTDMKVKDVDEVYALMRKCDIGKAIENSVDSDQIEFIKKYSEIEIARKKNKTDGERVVEFLDVAIGTLIQIGKGDLNVQGDTKM